MEPRGLGKTIFQEKYADGDESWIEASTRVARAVSSHDEGYEPKFFHEIATGKFMPGGRIWYGAGKIKQQMLNCFVVPTEDSREGWGTTLYDLTVITGTGGGVGFNFSPIRPRGAQIAGVGGQATGSVSLMQMLDGVSSQMVGGASRRAAMMMCLDITHPDILEFIEAKLNRSALNNANVSVVLPPGFSADTLASKYYGYDTIELKHNGQVYGEIEARDFLDTVIGNALNSGEPGILNHDYAEKMSTVGYSHKLTSTNPCVTGDTVIAAVSGPRTFKSLADDGQDVQVYAWHPETKKPVIRWMRRPHKTRENAVIMRIEFDSGLVVRCTEDHHFYTFRGKKIKAKDLVVGKSLRAWSMSQHRDGHLRVHAWNSTTNTAEHQWVHRMVWESEYGPVPEGCLVHHKDHDPTNNSLDNLELMTEYQHQSHHYPERLANGFDGKGKNHKVVSVEYELETQDVYNGMVEDAHTYIILDPEPVAGIQSGIVSANCGEIWLPDYGCCCLGALVLPSFVHEGEFDWYTFARSVANGVRFLDNVLDVNYYPHHKIEQMCQAERRIGLGVMGLHSVLLDLGMRYDSDEAFEFVDKLFACLQRFAYQASIDLAIERGPFPLFDADGFLNSGYGQTLPTDIRERIRTHGIRNCAILTVAPTGTTSMVHGVTSGIEPLFAPAYYRRRKIQGARVGDFDIATTLVVHNDYLNHPELAQGAYDIKVEDHLYMQSIVQRYVDNAVSKTINVDKSADKDSIVRTILDYLPQLKGVTLYQEGSRDDEPLEAIRLDVVPKVLSTWEGELDYEGLDSLDCVSGVCAI